MDQFYLFLTVENFKLAFIRLKTASRNNYKSIYYEDLKIFGLFLDENIETLINNIKSNIYKPSQCFKYFIPKKDNLVRPLSMLVFTDLLIYQALVNIIADFTYDTISPNYNNVNFGNQVNLTASSEKDKIFFFKSWKTRWKNFNEKSKHFYERGYEYLSEFDIASFYDTIDHHILRELLIKIFRLDEKLCNFLYDYLEAWTCDFSHSNAFTSKHGIPQGPIFLSRNVSASGHCGVTLATCNKK